MTVLKGDKLREESKNLKADPILIGLYEELKAMGVSPKEERHGNYMHFLSATAREYRNRGGKFQQTIGGPGEALIELEKEREE